MKVWLEYSRHLNDNKKKKFNRELINPPVYFHLSSFDLSFKRESWNEHKIIIIIISNCSVSLLCYYDDQLWHWPDGGPVLIPVQSVQCLLFIHSQLDVAELPALGQEPNLYLTRHHYVMSVLCKTLFELVWNMTKNTVWVLLVYQIREVLSAGHLVELFHGVKGNTEPGHQLASICVEQRWTTHQNSICIVT